MSSRRRPSEYKPLLFTTTLRNPERIKSFLSVIAKYNGQILSNDVIHKIVFELISNKIYMPKYIKSVPDLKAKSILDEPFSFNDTNRIIKNSPQNHTEPGFDRGWPSRFDTWYEFLKELGLVYYEMNKPIEISEAGQSLILAKTEGFEHLEQQVFLSSFAKYQTNNPFKRVKNKNKPLILLLKVIKKLKEILGNNSTGVHINEIPLFICWKDDDYLALTNKILEIRSLYGFNTSDDYVYGVCKDILNFTDKDENRFKKSNICHEMPDDFIRKMRMTGLVSIRGGGRFIDLNNQESNKIEYIINKYSEIKIFTSEREYFDYVKNIDLELVSLNKVLSIDDNLVRQQFLKWVNEFDLEILTKEIIVLTKNKFYSKHHFFKFINEPLRLEFLTALILQKRFRDIVVQPNYITDDEGVPVSFAPGNVSDIICKDSLGNVLFEVTLMKGRQQVVNEMIPIERHLKEIKLLDQSAFSVFVAPNIHPDAIQYSAFAKYQSGIDIVTIDIPTFANSINNITNVRSFLN